MREKKRNIERKGERERVCVHEIDQEQTQKKKQAIIRATETNEWNVSVLVQVSRGKNRNKSIIKNVKTRRRG